MKRIRAICAGLLLAASLSAQEGYLTISAPQWKGWEIWFASRLEPPGTRLPGAVVVEPGVAHHTISDRAHKRQFGYSIALDPSEDGKTVQIRIQPLNPEDAKAEPGWTLLGLPQYPVIPNVKPGETVALDLLVNPATGQKVVDYLTVRRHGAMDLQREARDFRVSDAELTFMNPQIFVDGKPQPETPGVGTSGAVISLYIAGHGRFVLSLLPYDELGFRKDGVVSGSGLSFRDGATEVRVESSARIAPGSGVYNLYVLQEPQWQPKQGVGTIGSADKPEYIIGKK